MGMLVASGVIVIEKSKVQSLGQRVSAFLENPVKVKLFVSRIST